MSNKTHKIQLGTSLAEITRIDSIVDFSAGLSYNTVGPELALLSPPFASHEYTASNPSNCKILRLTKLFGYRHTAWNSLLLELYLSLRIFHICLALPVILLLKRILH